MPDSDPITILHGDCIDRLRELPDESIDAVVTDPPYHLTSSVKRFWKPDAAPARAKQTGAYARASKGFMGKEWGGGDIAIARKRLGLDQLVQLEDLVA